MSAPISKSTAKAQRPRFSKLRPYISRDPLSTIRAEFKVRGRLLAAPGAGPKWLLQKRGREGTAGFRKNASTAVTFQEALPSLDRDEGNEKEAQIMIQALEAG